jgi:DNA-binding transcriptional LysR family regulator
MDPGVEQVALIGIVLFAAIAVLHGFNTVRGIRRAAARAGGEGRMRRLVASDPVAREVARGVVREVAAAHPEATIRSREAGRVDPDLLAPLDKAEAYFRERVEPRLRPLFHLAVDEVILGKTV